MPFEFDDKKIKTTLIMIRRRDGSVKYSGMVRLSWESGETYLRPTAAIDNSIIFDEVQWITQDPNADSEFALIGYDSDWGLTVV
jgi:hypothetical protein